MRSNFKPCGYTVPSSEGFNFSVLPNAAEWSSFSVRLGGNEVSAVEKDCTELVGRDAGAGGASDILGIKDWCQEAE